jgi:hypothetical protein
MHDEDLSTGAAPIPDLKVIDKSALAWTRL